MAKTIAQKPISRSSQAIVQQQSIFKKIASFITGTPPARVGARPISAKDSFTKRPPNHVYAPAALRQTVEGVRPTNRPSDLQLTQFCSKVITS
ncbi:MAG: hypothetical protein HYT76_03375 [Deltaproteobacteria bacterium]|nr:hypothetical protein [Deltaproteobacteria bacterium]